MQFTEGPSVSYTPLLRVPWYFPFQPGIQGYRRAVPEDKGQPVCIVTGKPVQDANGRTAKAGGEDDKDYVL